jgi:NTE family protein
MSTMMTTADWLREKPFSLSLSSGFFGFFAHCGLMSVLEDRNLLPERISGSSAGGLIAGLWAAGLDSEYIRKVLSSGKREDFWDPHLGFGFLKGERFRDLLREHLPLNRVEACKVPLALSVFRLPDLETEVLREGPLVEAIYASCAVPGMFAPIKIHDAYCVDGGVRDRPGWDAFEVTDRVFCHYLLSRSRWRRWTGVGWGLPPTQENRLTIAIANLPRVGPFHLERGELAFNFARKRFGDILDRSMHTLSFTV